MPQRTIYLNDELDAAVKAHDVPVGDICRRALWAELNARGWLGIGHLTADVSNKPTQGGSDGRQG